MFLAQPGKEIKNRNFRLRILFSDPQLILYGVWLVMMSRIRLYETTAVGRSGLLILWPRQCFASSDVDHTSSVPGHWNSLDWGNF